LLLGLFLHDLEGLGLVTARQLEGDAIVAFAELNAFGSGLTRVQPDRRRCTTTSWRGLLGRAAHAIGHGLTHDSRQPQRALGDRGGGDPVGLRGIALDGDLLVERMASRRVSPTGKPLSRASPT